MAGPGIGSGLKSWGPGCSPRPCPSRRIERHPRFAFGGAELGADDGRQHRRWPGVPDSRRPRRTRARLHLLRFPEQSGPHATISHRFAYRRIDRRLADRRRVPAARRLRLPRCSRHGLAAISKSWFAWPGELRSRTSPSRTDHREGDGWISGIAVRLSSGTCDANAARDTISHTARTAGGHRSPGATHLNLSIAATLIATQSTMTPPHTNGWKPFPPRTRTTLGKSGRAP